MRVFPIVIGYLILLTSQCRALGFSCVPVLGRLLPWKSGFNLEAYRVPDSTTDSLSSMSRLIDSLDSNRNWLEEFYRRASVKSQKRVEGILRKWVKRQSASEYEIRKLIELVYYSLEGTDQEIFVRSLSKLERQRLLSLRYLERERLVLKIKREFERRSLMRNNSRFQGFANLAGTNQGQIALSILLNIPMLHPPFVPTYLPIFFKPKLSPALQDQLLESSSLADVALSFQNQNYRYQSAKRLWRYGMLGVFLIWARYGIEQNFQSQIQAKEQVLKEVESYGEAAKEINRQVNERFNLPVEDLIWNQWLKDEEEKTGKKPDPDSEEYREMYQEVYGTSPE